VGYKNSYFSRVGGGKSRVRQAMAYALTIAAIIRLLSHLNDLLFSLLYILAETTGNAQAGKKKTTKRMAC
jgi:hypothetical protein